MPTYKTDKKCYIGDAVRQEGETFTCSQIVKPLPKWLKVIKLTAKQKADLKKQQEEDAEKLEEDEEEIDQVTHSATAEIEQL